MFSIMIHGHAPDAEASLAFYRKLDFTVYADDVDGHGMRCLRLKHPRCEGLLLNLKDAPELLRPAQIDPDLPPELWPVLFTIVVDNYVVWVDRLKDAGIAVEHLYAQPWGGWLHMRDPAGNLIAITDNDLY